MEKIIRLAISFIFCVFAILGCTKSNSTHTVVYGNIITMDDKKPNANALIAKDGIITYIGNKEEVSRIFPQNAKVLDYGDNYIYPGFIEPHSHGILAGYRAIGQGDLSKIYPADYDKYREIIKDFINKNPNKEIYLISGWVEDGTKLTKKFLDDIYKDKPVIMNTAGGHTCLLNTKALEWAGVDKEFAKKWGPNLVYVDEHGEPTGYICEQPALELVGRIPVSMEEAKSYLLKWQEIMFSKGFTVAAEAGAELFFKDSSKVYNELEKEGKLKLRTYAYSLVDDNVADPKGAVNHIVEERKKYNGEYYSIIGVKAFLDGVMEAHTAWLTKDYNDKPGYHGLERFNDHNKMVELITAASEEDMSVHVHSIGDGATNFMLGCIEDSQKITGNLDQRNILAHLFNLDSENMNRMARTGSIPAVAPLWTAFTTNEYNILSQYIGQERAENVWPIKSFFNAGANVVYHSDYPISPILEISRTIYMAKLRAYPPNELGGQFIQYNIKEAVDNKDSILAMTKNAAFALRQEARMGSLEVGKLANLTVSNSDFLNDNIDIILNSSIIATVVDGEEVYKK